MFMTFLYKDDQMKIFIILYNVSLYEALIFTKIKPWGRAGGGRKARRNTKAKEFICEWI